LGTSLLGGYSEGASLEKVLVPNPEIGLTGGGIGMLGLYGC
jgi:hypothetical protein